MNNDDTTALRELLAQRIEAYAEQRGLVRQQIVELNHTLITTQQRLDAAVEMYRLEFGEETGPVSPGRSSRVTPIPAEDSAVHTQRRARERAGSSWNASVTEVLQQAGEPLHLNAIWERMSAGGFETEAKDPRRSLASVLVRHGGVVRTGPNTYGLRELGAVPAPPDTSAAQLDIDHAPDEAPHHPQEDGS